MEKPQGYPEVAEDEDDTTSYSVDWFRPGAKNDMSLLESGILGKYYADHEDYYNFESKFGMLSDPRLLAVVEFFRELYFRRRELFKATFPKFPDHHIFEVLKDSATKLWRVKSSSDMNTRVVTLQRSSSLESPRLLMGTRDFEPPLKNEWIKVKTLNTGGGETTSGGGGSK